MICAETSTACVNIEICSKGETFLLSVVIIDVDKEVAATSSKKD